MCWLLLFFFFGVVKWSGLRLCRDQSTKWLDIVHLWAGKSNQPLRHLQGITCMTTWDNNQIRQKISQYSACQYKGYCKVTLKSLNFLPGPTQTLAIWHRTMTTHNGLCLSASDRCVCFSLFYVSSTFSCLTRWTLSDKLVKIRPLTTLAMNQVRELADPRLWLSLFWQLKLTGTDILRREIQLWSPRR